MRFLKPITLLLGPNNYGKSSIISGFRILSQTVKSYDNNVPLLLNGEMGDFGSYGDIVYKNSKRRKIEIKFSIEPFDWDRSMLSLKSKQSIGLSMKFSYRSKLQELILSECTMNKHNSILIQSKYSDDSERQSINIIADKELPQAVMGQISRKLRMKNFMPIRIIGVFPNSDESQLNQFYKVLEKTNFEITRMSHYLQNTLENIEYVGAMRVAPSRLFLYSGEKRQHVGANGENSINILAMDNLRKGSRAKGILSNVIEWLNSAGIASDVKMVKLSDRYYEIHFQHPETKEYQNFADVGYGNSQVIPVLVAGFNLADGSLFLVEEPEIHLHPRAQAELGNFFSVFIKGIYNP
ncbi:MAG: AAA family ATPase [Caulobacteraceae bacterium]